MSLSIIYTRAQLGVEAPLVTVETHISNGLPSLSIAAYPKQLLKKVKSAFVVPS